MDLDGVTIQSDGEMAQNRMIGLGQPPFETPGMPHEGWSNDVVSGEASVEWNSDRI